MNHTKKAGILKRLTFVFLEFTGKTTTSKYFAKPLPPWLAIPIKPGNGCQGGLEQKGQKGER